MSDVMLLGVLRMPHEMAMSDPLSSMQFWQRAQEAADRIERDAVELATLRAQLAASEASRKELREVLELLGRAVEKITLGGMDPDDAIDDGLIRTVNDALANDAEQKDGEA